MREPTPGIKGISDEVLQTELMREAARLTRNPADAEDLVQDTLERGLRKRDLLRYGSLRTWLLHIMRNLFIDRCRRKRPIESGVELLSIPAEVNPLPKWIQVSDAALAAAIAGLDPRSREILILKDRQGCSYAEISGRLGIPVPTVGTRLMRARRKLRQLLCEGGEIAEDDSDEEGQDAQLH